MTRLLEEKAIKKPTLQMLNFVSELFKPEVAFNGSEAYRRAYPRCKGGHNALAARLIAKDSIQQLIASKRAEISKQTGFTILQAQIEYEEARELAVTTRQPAAMVSATTGKARLYGMDKDAGSGEKTIIIISPKVSRPVESRPIASQDADTGDKEDEGQGNAI